MSCHRAREEMRLEPSGYERRLERNRLHGEVRPKLRFGLRGAKHAAKRFARYRRMGRTVMDTPSCRLGGSSRLDGHRKVGGSACSRRVSCRARGKGSDMSAGLGK